MMSLMKKRYPFEDWFNKLETKHLIIGFIIWSFVYRIIDAQTLDWFGKSNDANPIIFLIQFLVASAFFGSVVALVLFPILKFLGLIKDY